MNKAIFLDRDGVLNHAIVKNGKPFPPASVSELTIPEDAASALGQLKQAGFYLIGVTNQPDVPRGKTTKETVQSINEALKQYLPLDDIHVCYHDDADNCHCRKPLPGLILDAASHYNVDISKSFMIGDRWKDIEAGKRATCKTIWLDYNYDEARPTSEPDFTTTTLTDAANWILTNNH